MNKTTPHLTPDQEKIWDALNRQFMAPETQLLSRKEAIEYTDDDTATRGWYWRLSASGYLDCTDWSGPWSTEFSAALDCIDTWGDDVELDEDVELTMATMAYLMDYYTAEVIREATTEETQESLAAGEEGVIVVEIDGADRKCYVHRLV